MRRLPFAVAGTLIWLALMEESGLRGALFGGALGFVCAEILVRRTSPGTPSGTRGAGRSGTPSRGRYAWACLRLLIRFSAEVLIANLQQLRIVLAPRLRVRPRWLVYRTELRDPRLRVLLGLMLSLTPGTITAELEADALLVHVLDTRDPEAVEERIRRRFEGLLQELEP